MWTWCIFSLILLAALCPIVKPRQAKELYSPRAVAAILSHPRFALLQALVSRCIKLRNERLLFGLAKSAVLN